MYELLKFRKCLICKKVEIIYRRMGYDKNLEMLLFSLYFGFNSFTLPSSVRWTVK